MEQSPRPPASADAARWIAALDVGVVVHDADTRLAYENAAVERLLGLRVADLLTKDSLDVPWDVIRADGTPFPTTDLPLFDVLRTGEAVHATMLGVRLPTKAVRWISVDAVPVRGPTGKVAQVLVTLTDVSGPLAGRYATAGDDGARRTHGPLDLDVLHGILRAMAEGVALHDTDSTILFANPSAETILGLSLAQLQGRTPIEPWWGLTDGDGTPLAPERIPSEITRRTGIPQRNTRLGVRRADGALRWLSVNTDPIGEPDADGHRRVVATFADVHAEQAALAEVEAARDRLRRLMEALPGAVLELRITADDRTEIVFASRQLEEVTGVPVFAALTDAAALWRRFATADRERLAEEWRRAIATGSAFALEVPVARQPGDVRWVRLKSGLPDTGPDGTLFRLILLDVTEQRQIEQSLREAQRRDAMGTLAAGIAHNFNNMLAAIVPNLEMLREIVPEAFRAEADDAYRAATAAGELVRQLLLLSRREEASPAEALDLGAMAEETARLCRRTFDSGIEIRCVPPPTPVCVLGRRSEVQQVILNLCLNARDAVGGVPTPAITLRVAAEGEYATLEVEDNGAGIAPDIRQRIGEPFFTTKPPGHGTGLGVASIIGILRELGGSLRYEPAAGRGTRAVATLPWHGTRAAPQAAAAPVAARASGRGRLLIVDDEEMVRRTLARTFARLGFEIVQAGNGSDALVLLEQHPDIRLAVIDRSMPGMSGAELHAHIRTRLPQLPVIVCSGYDTGTIAPDPYTRTLGKPYTQSDVEQLLQQLLPDA